MKLQNKKTLIFVCVIVVLFIAGIISWLIINSIQSDNPTAAVYKNGELVREIILYDDYDHNFIVGIPGDMFNTIYITNGKIGVIDASCPDKICINTGFISNGIIPVICLPNKLEIRIINTKNINEPDAVSR